jgi:hypothetical protein
MMRILYIFIFLISVPFLGKANEKLVSEPISTKQNMLPELLKGRSFISKTNLIHALYLGDSSVGTKSASYQLKLDSIIVSERSEVSGILEKSYLHTCTFDTDGNRVVVNIFYWDTENKKWKINDENYYLFDENKRLKQVEFQEYFLPTYRWYTRIDYEYENGLLKTESRYDKVDEIEFWDEIEQIEYVYNADNSIHIVNSKEWDLFESDWVTNAYSKFDYDSIGNLVTESGFDYNAYDMISTRKFEIQYRYDVNNNLAETVKYGPGEEEEIFEEEWMEVYTYNEYAELTDEVFYNWDYDLKIWLNAEKKLYINEAQGSTLFEESKHLWDEKKSDWVASSKTDYISEFNYLLDDIQNWNFLQVYMPAYSFNKVVCDKIEFAAWENDEWQVLSSNDYYFSEDTNVGIEDSKDLAISVYPNPVTNLLTITTGSISESTCTIRDLNGRVLTQTYFQNNTQIDMTGFTPGIYLIELTSDTDRIYINKIIKK